MGIADFRFYGPLNDFLPAARRGRTIRRRFDGEPAVKDLIEALGVPHPEVELVVVDGEPVGFGHRVRDGERVAVYPPFRALELGSVVRAGPPPVAPGEPRFVLDGHLGRLVAYLRMLGFDTAYRNDAADDELARLAAEEDRILLTRDRGLLKRSVVSRGYFVREDRPHDQLAEVANRFGLEASARPFGRCLRCNGVLEPVAREAVLDRLPPRVRWEQAEFRRCTVCDSLYWKGSHYRRMRPLVEAVAPGWPEDAGGDPAEGTIARP